MKNPHEYLLLLIKIIYNINNKYYNMPTEIVLNCYITKTIEIKNFPIILLLAKKL
jgi:hypothetical protein